jgi:hypothetical protein
MRCSLPPPPVVIAYRTGPPPALTVRNMLVLVPVPKSHTRAHALTAAGFTHVLIVKSFRPLTTPAGIDTNWATGPNCTALPNTPGTRPTSNDPGSGSRWSSHSSVRIASLMSSAMPSISSALASLPRTSYASAAAFAPEYQNALSVRSCAPP